jgi:hypothetical protein
LEAGRVTEKKENAEMETAAKLKYTDVERIDITGETVTIKDEIDLVPAQARAITVIDAATYTQAGELIVIFRKLKKKVDDTFVPIKKAMDAAKKIILDKEKEHHKPIDDAIALVTREMMNYRKIEAETRAEAERKLQDEARKKAEEAKLADAVAAEKAGESKVAEAIMSAKTEVPTIKLTSEAPKVKGVSFRENWTYEITNKDLIPEEYWILDESAIGKVVRALKDKTNIPGIRVYDTESLVGRTK